MSPEGVNQQPFTESQAAVGMVNPKTADECGRDERISGEFLAGCLRPF